MKKLFIIPILIAFAFSQLQSKQASYIIYTDGKVYNNVVLHSVQGSYLLFNENNSTKKNRIPINNITGIYNEDRSNLNINSSGCVYGLGLGALTGGLIGLVLDSGGGGGGDATATGPIIPFLPVAILGGIGIGALLGSMSGESSSESKSTFISLEDKTLDEKINFFKSRVNQ